MNIRGSMLGFLAMVVAAGCATDKSAHNKSSPPPRAVLLQLEPGPLVLTSSFEPAIFEFEPPRGRVESAGEGAGRAARAILTTPNLIHPQLEAAVGAVEFVLAPFAAGYGALSAGRRMLPADKLAEANEELTQAMRAMAGQEHLSSLLLEYAGEKTHRRLVRVAPSDEATTVSRRASAFVETSIESLRLQRTSASHDTYALVMKARARVVSAADGEVVFDRQYDFRSDEALFVDWARAGGFKSVAETGYRDLAEQVARDLFTAPAGESIRLGPEIAARRNGTGMAHAKPGPRSSFAGISPNTGHANPEFVTDDGSPRVGFAALRDADIGSFEIYSRGEASNFLIQSPPTPEEPNPEAMTETEWLLGGLENDRNAVVQAAACLAAVPIGLWEQTVGLLRRRSSEALESAQRELRMVTCRMQPHQAVADEFARVLASETSRPVALVNDEFGVPDVSQSALVPCLFEATPARFPDTEARPASASAHAPATAVEIHVVDVRLARMPGSRARLTLCVDSKVTLRRNSDGQELYSFPVSYRSAGKSLEAWAGDDAALFRGELAKCCKEVGIAAAEELVSCGLISPMGGPTPALAQR